MGKVPAGITVSVDGFITGPALAQAAGSGSAASACTTGCSAGPGARTRLSAGSRAGADRAWLEETLGANGAVIAGRGTYEAAGHWAARTPRASRCTWSLTAPQGAAGRRLRLRREPRRGDRSGQGCGRR